MTNTLNKIKQEQGLSDADVERSRAENGANVMTQKVKKGFWGHFVSNLNDPIIKILISALIINIIFVFRTADWVETAGIAISVFLATFISTVSEYGSENAFSKLNEENENYMCRVRRNNKIAEIHISEVVCGDIVLLSSGDKIPADGFIIKGRLVVDQSAMTGESIEVEKAPSGIKDLSPKSGSALLRGCSVIAGDGELLVTVVGDKTFIGEISQEIQTDTIESPLKARLSKLAKQISRLGYAAAILVGIVYLFNAIFLDSFMDKAVIIEKISNPRYVLETFLNAFTLGLTVVVVTVPDGICKLN